MKAIPAFQNYFLDKIPPPPIIFFAAGHGGSVGDAEVHTVVRIITGVVLLIAALAKSQLVASEAVHPNTLDFHWYSGLASIMAEVFLGLWLLFGVYPVASRRVAVLVFFLLAVFALVKWQGGEKSCECFGAIPVPPFATLLFDMLIVGLLLGTPLHNISSKTPCQSRMLLTSFLALSLGVGLYLYSSATNLSRCLFFEENRYDFGDSDQRQTLTHDFVMRNLASYPVEVVQARSNCGCTVASNMEGVVVSPNEVLRIPVVLKTGNHEEGMAASISIFCRPLGSQQTPLLAQQLRVVTTVQPEYWARPIVLDFGEVTGDGRVIRTLRIHRNKLKSMTLQRLNSSNPAFNARVIRTEDDDDIIEVVLNPYRAHRKGPLEAKLTIQTDARIKPVSTVILRADIHPPIEVDPSFILVGSYEKGTVERRIRVRSRLDQEIGLTVDSTFDNSVVPVAIKEWDVCVQIPPADGSALAEQIRVYFRVAGSERHLEQKSVLVPVHRLPIRGE